MRTKILSASLVFLTTVSLASGADPVEFARDVLPVLSSNCFACHGPDEHDRQAGLRLDVEAEAKSERDDGAAIVAGSLEKSVFIDRITSSDPEKVMPPPKAKHQLTSEQIAKLKQWIVEGAKWQKHWSLEPVKRPSGTLDDQVKFLLIKKRLELQKAASPETLIRRLSLDLIGLPPSSELVATFTSKPTSQTYEQAVDTLLAQKEFGEHWARTWLDLARYADTKGYEKDLGRTMWPYRDWVVNAINDDMLLAQFTREQLAGDLLPNPTQSQIIATAFHRNTMANDEGGTDDEEFRTIAIKDRIDTTVQVWMGMTMGCAKCHSHKYDPISQKEYYQFFAIFNQTEDADRYDDEPRLQLIDDKQQEERITLRSKIDEAEKKLNEVISQWTNSSESLWKVPKVSSTSTKSGATLKRESDGSLIVEGQANPTDTYVTNYTVEAGEYRSLLVEVIPSAMAEGKLGLGRNGKDPNFVLSELQLELITESGNKPQKLKSVRASFSQGGWPIEASVDGNPKTGWAVSPQSRQHQAALFELSEPLKLDGPAVLRVSMIQDYGDSLTMGRYRVSLSDVGSAQLLLPGESELVKSGHETVKNQQKELTAFENKLVRLPVMRELAADKSRITKIHTRGNFLEPGDEVKADLLSAFGNVEDSVPRTRLGVAGWLVSPENPLTPRVWANRVWARIFGIGIVETEEDFGALGTPPTNPALLELLAAEYRDNGWSLKKLIKFIVMSETYKQSSIQTGKLKKVDPRNQWSSRGARYRLTSEVIRDQALSIAGILSLKKGGPSVMPPQPAGLWRSTYNGQNWIDAEGEDRYRRGIYTYLKRTTPYPSLTTFDGGSGEVCQIRRIRSNTPLQALVTLNDPVYLEASAAFAKQIVNHAGTDREKIAYGLKKALIRDIRSDEPDLLVNLLDAARKDFSEDLMKAESFVKSCRGEPGESAFTEFASWIVVANTIFNLDEFLSRN